MKKLLLLLFCSVTAFVNAQSLTPQQTNKINKLFKHKTEVYFTFQIADKSEVTVLTKIISIDNVKNGKVWAYANRNEFAKFIVLNYKYKVLTNPSQLKKVKTKNISSLHSEKSVTAYPTYQSYEALMAQYATTYPSLCKLVVIGTLPSGHRLLALKISDNVNIHENEPEFLYTSTIHGDETAGYIGMLDLIDYLLTNYGSNARLTSLVNNVEIWINPLANPDGCYAAGNNTVNGATRYNANNIDINRNYPDPQAGQHPDGNAWQPETVAFMAFADSLNLTMSANFHGGAEVVNYPWDTWPTLHADNDWWVRESHRFADTSQANAPAGYLTSVNANGITDGFAWYQITGGRQDYMNFYKQCRECTIELSDIKLIDPTDFSTKWNANYRSYLNYIEESLNGIRGVITDACTNQPIRAKVFITGHDFDSSHVYSSPLIGDYHRHIYQGTYNVTYSAPGYVSQTINGVNVVDGSATIVDIVLSPAPPVSDFAITSMDNCSGVVNFNDLSGSAVSWHWLFGDGSTSTSQNPSHVYTSNGTFNVSLVVTNCAGNDSIFKSNYITITAPDMPIAHGDSSLTCLPESLTLTATASGVLNWYTAPTGGTSVGTGASFTTPVLSNTTTYYVENEVAGASQYVGALNTSMGNGGYFTAATYHYLSFNATIGFKLISVWVQANTAGNRTIELRTSTGTVLQSATVNIPSGQSRITLNFNVPAGTGLQLGTAGGTTNNLYRNSAGGNYPYSIAGLVSIIGNSANNPAYYYYFYDWEVAQFCASNRVAAVAIINPTTPVGALISSNDTAICQGATAVFNASISNGGSAPSYQWQVNGINTGANNALFSSASLNTGDVVTCIETSSNTCATANPANSNSISVLVHALPPTPVISQAGYVLNSNAANGNQWYANGTGLINGETTSAFAPATTNGYYVIVTDANGCQSDTSNVIQFLSSGIASLDENMSVKMYPNPCNEDLFLDVSNTNSDLSISIFNVLGKQVYAENTRASQVKINCTSFANGIYFITLKQNDKTHTEKFIVRKR